MRPPVPLDVFAARFWRKVRTAGPDECWVWAGGRSGKYGAVRVGSARRGAHEVALRLSLGLSIDAPLPRSPVFPHDQLCTLHRCDNPPCCNPSHLFQGTKADNVRDMLAKGRGRYGSAWVPGAQGA